MKKFIVNEFLYFKMVISGTITSQVQESQFILHDIHVEDISLSDLFQMTVIIEKL